MSLLAQFAWLLLLAIPVACVSWTVTHEEIFSEPREFCKRKSKESKQLFLRKFFYIFTCEYCFSFYVSIFFLIITRYQLLFSDWRGYFLAVFALVWVANFYMSIFFRIRIQIKKEGIESKIEEHRQQMEAAETAGKN